MMAFLISMFCQLRNLTNPVALVNLAGSETVSAFELLDHFGTGSSLHYAVARVQKRCLQFSHRTVFSRSTRRNMDSKSIGSHGWTPNTDQGFPVIRDRRFAEPGARFAPDSQGPMLVQY